MKNITSIKVSRNTKYNKIQIFVNFDNGTFGTRIKEDGKWYNSNLTAEELEAARAVAFDSQTKNWHNYTAPRAESITPATFVRKDEEDLECESIRNFRQPVTFASTSDREQ